MRRFVFAVLAVVALTGCSDFFYSRDLAGEVVSKDSRFKGGQGGAEEKVGLVVKATNPDSKIEEVACGPSGCAIECTSTRCSSILPGTCHSFECKYHHRWGEPDVIECKHLKELPCPESK